MSLKQQLTDDMKAAMKGGEKDKLLVIRLINAAIKQREVDERIQLDDTQVLAVLEKMVKQRRDSIQQFEKAGRQDLIDIEATEIAVIQDFLPRALEPAEIDTLIETALRESGASEMKDMGKVMALLKPQVQGRADMGVVSQRIKARLA